MTTKTDKKSEQAKRYNGDGSEWMPEEVEALPQTPNIFEQKPLDFKGHVWIQEGYHVIDMCEDCPRYALPIPSGKLLILEEGEYKLVDEVTRK